jgi:LuxR family transcriptional regulator, maltose regulon positive regulatory protein
MAQESGTPVGTVLGQTLVAQAVFETGDYQRATKELAAAQKLALPIGSKLYQFMRHFIRAYFAFEMGQESEGADALGEAMRLGRQAGYTIVPNLWQPQILARLCAKALEIGIEVEYARNLIATLKLLPDTPAMELEDWPWPVKIYTFDRFTLVKDGEPASTSGKTQKKPLLMLKAIIALGGDAVRKERIIDALWPDAEGDVGQIAFHTTISRLRRLVGEEAIVLHGGKVSINNRYCWVDSWAFERLCVRMDSIDHKEQASFAIRSAADRAVDLYKGTFLPADTECFFTISSRERLRSQYLQLIGDMGNVLEKAQDWQGAAAYYSKGLAADPITEEFYQGLMNCHIHLGRKAEGMIVYQRCRKVLHAELGVEPSEKTEALGKEMLKC